MGGYAYKLIQHLSVNDQNFTEAIQILKDQFLDIGALVDDLLKKLLDLRPKYDPEHAGAKLYLSEVRCILSDLTSFKCDLTGSEPAMRLVSHIIFHKLPYAVKQELARKLNNNYPTIKEIYSNYVDVIKTLGINKVKTGNSAGVKKYPNLRQTKISGRPPAPLQC